jgi:hypothetical protein
VQSFAVRQYPDLVQTGNASVPIRAPRPLAASVARDLSSLQ